MPTLPDLELNDFDLKPYMDPSILLDTFSPEDMDIWQSYNLFVDDSINSSIKEQIKEENTDIMDCCFSSICPNDLINNSNNNLDTNTVTNTLPTKTELPGTNNNNNNQQQPIYNVHYEQQNSNEYYSQGSSSCSSSPSIVDANQYFEQKPNQVQLNLDSLNFNAQQICQQQCLISNGNTFHQVYAEPNNGGFGNKIEYFQIGNNSENDTSLSPCSSTSSASSTNGDFIGNLNQSENNYQFQKMSKKVQKLNQQQPIIIVEASSLTNQQIPTTPAPITQKQLTKKTSNCLPPSPPSSFGSDSESNQSTTSSTNHTHIPNNTHKSTLKPSTKFKSNKLNNQLRSNATSTIVKQLRHQPYTFKSSNKCSPKLKAITIKSECSLDTSSSCLNLSTNSDDDCWPFLCSISKLPSSGPIMLTEEEKRTLVQEGHQVPTQLPLSKSEEKVLKKIRRKIKNKISAQESRRKKKEYVDSLEKRMESYINENNQLRKRLETLELNNKSLTNQLQSASNAPEFAASVDSANPLNNINSANQFGTLLMVLVLFFTVLLGVWSPLITKDQLGQASVTTATAAAASIGVRNGRGSVNSMSYSATSATTTAAVAVASLALFSSVANVKSESLSPAAAAAATGCEETNQIEEVHGQEEQNNFNMRPVILNDCEDDFLANDAILSGQVNNNNLTAMSKTGTAVELTKVRPFIRKLPTVTQPSATPNNNNDYVIQHSSIQETDNQQNNIIVLNLASNAQHKQPEQSTSDAPVNNLPVNFISSGQQQQQKPLNIQPANSLISLNPTSNSSYRVINTVQSNLMSGAQKLNVSTAGGNKLPTRFRLINNGINAFNTHHLTPSVIKLNTLA